MLRFTLILASSFFPFLFFFFEPKRACLFLFCFFVFVLFFLFFFCFPCTSKGTHIGAVSFSDRAWIPIRFTSNQDVDKVKASVLAIKHHKRGKRIDRGLEKCRMELFSVKKGMRSIVPPVLLTITHGRISNRKILDWTLPTFRGSANVFWRLN